MAGSLTEHRGKGHDLTFRPHWIVAVLLAALVCLVSFHLASAGTVSVLAPVTGADARLGLDDVLPGSSPGSGGAPWAQLAYNAGARVNRWEFRWDRIEPKKGKWNFGPDDADVSASRQYNLAIDGIIDGIPKWAVAPHQPRGNGVPHGLWKSPHNRKNLWAGFIRGLVAHYRGQVGYWEIWNEPDLKFFWNGTAADYARLLRVARSVIKETDPNARVVMAGMVAPDLTFAGQVLAWLHAHGFTGASSLGLAAWHAYGNASAIYTNLTHFQAVLAQYGFAGTPIWVTEDGFPASNPQGEQRQAAYILQTIAYAFAAGATHVLVYRASDDTSPQSWGLMRATGSPRMGYVAFQIAAQYFGHTQALVHDPGAHFERFVFYQANRRVVLLWNRSEQDSSFNIPAGQDSATLVDWQGQQTAITPTDGSWIGSAPGAIYNQGVDPKNKVVGGPPEVLIEDNTPPDDLPLTSYVASLKGTQRQLVLFNPSTSPASAEVTADGNAAMRQVVQIAPGALARVDLDLLAGPGYGGGYKVGSNTDLTALAASNTVTESVVQPASNWYVPAAPAAVTLDNVQAKAVHASLVAYNPSGRSVGRRTITVAKGASVSWSPSGHSRPYTLSVQADAPIVLEDSSGTPLQPAAAPASALYAPPPGKGALVLFNPQDTALQINAQFFGAPTVESELLNLAPLQTYTLSTHGARAVSLVATAGVVATYRSSVPAAPPVVGALTSTTLAAAGPATNINLVNPSAQPAHVTLNVVTAKGTTTITRTLKPSQAASVPVRKRGGPPSAVLLSSDVAVDAAAAP